jgi:hypothetical protein
VNLRNVSKCTYRKIVSLTGVPYGTVYRVVQHPDKYVL